MGAWFGSARARKTIPCSSLRHTAKNLKFIFQVKLKLNWIVDAWFWSARARKANPCYSLRHSAKN
jgi:hypothetical protein